MSITTGVVYNYKNINVYYVDTSKHVNIDRIITMLNTLTHQQYNNNVSVSDALRRIHVLNITDIYQVFDLLHTLQQSSSDTDSVEKVGLLVIDNIVQIVLNTKTISVDKNRGMFKCT